MKKKLEDYKKSAIKKQSELLDDKTQLEEIILKQEETLDSKKKKIKTLEENVSVLTNENKVCNNENLILVKKIDDLKKHITDLNSRIGAKVQVEEKVKYNFLEKDQEIRFLKNFVSNLKSDNKGTHYFILFYVVKDLKYSTLKGKMNKLTEDNKSLRDSINAMEYKNQVYNMLSSDDDNAEMENGKSNNIERSNNKQINEEVKVILVNDLFKINRIIMRMKMRT